MKLNKRVQQILDEIRTVLERIDSTAASAIVERLRASRRIYVAGGGRSGLMVRAFAQRLMQLGFTTYVVGETTTPAISKADVLLVCSGSGETQVTVLVSQVAKQIGAHVIAITANPDSSIAKIADTLLVLEAPHKQAPLGGIPSVQFGGSAFEQSLVILLDAIALEIGLLLGRSREDLEERHANLE